MTKAQAIYLLRLAVSEMLDGTVAKVKIQRHLQLNDGANVLRIDKLTRELAWVEGEHKVNGAKFPTWEAKHKGTEVTVAQDMDGDFMWWVYPENADIITGQKCQTESKAKAEVIRCLADFD